MARLEGTHAARPQKPQHTSLGSVCLCQAPFVEQCAAQRHKKISLYLSLLVPVCPNQQGLLNRPPWGVKPGSRTASFVGLDRNKEGLKTCRLSSCSASLLPPLPRLCNFLVRFPHQFPHQGSLSLRGVLLPSRGHSLLTRQGSYVHPRARILLLVHLQ